MTGSPNILLHILICYVITKALHLYKPLIKPHRVIISDYISNPVLRHFSHNRAGKTAGSEPHDHAGTALRNR